MTMMMMSMEEFRRHGMIRHASVVGEHLTDNIQPLLDPTALTNYKPRLILWSLSHLLNFTRQR
jgi:hypothetical protein